MLKTFLNPSVRFGNAHLVGVDVYYKPERVLVYILLTILTYTAYYLGKTSTYLDLQ